VLIQVSSSPPAPAPGPGPGEPARRPPARSAEGHVRISLAAGAGVGGSEGRDRGSMWRGIEAGSCVWGGSPGQVEGALGPASGAALEALLAEELASLR
jgi:hypothetical protein